MKKVINGKMYNTETAKCVAYMSNGLRSNDCHYRCAELYRKNTGEFFVFDDGGWYSHSSDMIFPITEDRAKEIVADQCNGDTYESIFGTVEE